MAEPGEPYERIHMRAALGDVLLGAPEAPLTRPVSLDDLDWLMDLAWEVYPPLPPFDSRAALDALAAEYRAGVWGELVPEASPVALTADGEVRGAVVAVRRLPSPTAPDYPYLLDVMTVAAHRHQGVAAGMLGVSAAALRRSGETHVGLTVDADNVGALRLYERLGFIETGRRTQQGA